VEVWTEGLLSKWGLEDGDLLDPILQDMGFDLSVLNAHEVLVEIIRDHVLPKLENEIEFQVIGTLHNPIRITRVDGVVVDNYRPSHPEIDLRPDCVEVSDDVLRECATRWLARARDPHER
jgi:hypothetical protein